jgi:outer membrane protein assembly factor BamB
VYVTIGRDPTHGVGHGALTCIDATQTPGAASAGPKIWTRTGMRDIPGDITRTAIVWQYTDLKRSTSMPAVADGLVYVIDFEGDLHCLDAETGKVQWVHPTGRITMGSPLVADGKVYVGNQRRRLHILAAGREKKVLGEFRMTNGIDSTPVAANGTLFVATERYLYAVQKGATPVGGGR